MYLSKIHLVNWRSYTDAMFEFRKPSSRRPLVLVGAMNGSGKTSLLVSLYLGLFGRFGLKYCEGFDKFSPDDSPHYREAISDFRRNMADPVEPTSIELVFAPTLQDSGEEEVRVIRRWFFTSANKPKQGDYFETIEMYRDGKVIKLLDVDAAHESLSKYLFPPHIMPAFFFDGEQAQMLVNNSGAPGIKKAVEVMFGTKVVDEVHEQIQRYLSTFHLQMGGKKQASQKEQELQAKCQARDEINKRIAYLQKQEIEMGEEKDRLDLERQRDQETLARLGGEKALDVRVISEAAVSAEHDKTSAERSLTESVRNLGLSLAISRLAVSILNRLKSEEIRETWERLRAGTLERADQVLAAAMPEPPSADELLGHLSIELRERVKERFRLALAQIYVPPPTGCANEYLLGHVKGEHRQSTIDLVTSVRRQRAADIRQKAKHLKDAREQYEDAVARSERFSALPREVADLAERISSYNNQIAEAIRKLTSIENEVRKLKGDLHAINKRIGELQEEIARLEPAQKRVAVAERIHRVVDELVERLRPIALSHLQDAVTRHFLSIADRRFAGGKIAFPISEEGAPVFEWPSGNTQRIDTMSGFERRSFGIAFSLSLAEITQKRVPLVIDTPLGNADSEYRPRLLSALTNVDLDQVIILTHDQEVNGPILDDIEGQVLQKFLVVFDQENRLSSVHANSYFGGAS